MKSIRRDLTIRLLAITLMLAAAAGAGLFGFVRARLMAEFDGALLAEARSVSAVVVTTADGRLELDYVPSGSPDLGRAAYFEVRRLDGTAFRRSPSLDNHDLPPVDAPSGVPQFRDVALPGGNPGRGVAFRFRPHPDPDEGPSSAPRSAPLNAAAVPELIIVLAADRTGLDSTLRVLGSSMLLAAAGLCLGTTLAVIWTIRRGLRPLVRLADEADQIRGNSLHQRFSTHSLPLELRPIGRRLNELLARLQQAFGRERRFTADAAHELRTPIAELRSLAEVALRWPEDASPVQNYQDVLEIARHMESLVSTLLDLARCTAGATRISAETIHLSELVAQAWRSHEALASSRELGVRFDLAPNTIVRSDRVLLLGIVGNLLGNAAAHATRGGRVECRVRSDGDFVELSILNTSEGLRTEDLPRLFEPFWRKDAARSGGSHVGLGLALVAAYAPIVGAEIHADLDAAGNLFRVNVQFAGQSDAAHASGPSGSFRMDVRTSRVAHMAARADL